MAPILLITRPEPEAGALAARLEGCGARVVVSPLTGIAFRDIVIPEGSEAVFTSRNGVRAFVRAGGKAARAWCVGDATAEAARAAGMEAISAGGDAEDLLALLLRERPGAELCHVRGAQHRGDLVARLVAGGLRARAVEGYGQVPLAPTQAAVAAMRGRAPVVAPVYSPGAARRLAEAWEGGAPLLIGAISPAAAAPVKHLARNGLSIAAQPDGESMLTVLSGLIAAAHQLETGEGAV